MVLGRQAVPTNSFWWLSAYEKSYFCSGKLLRFREPYPSPARCLLHVLWGKGAVHHLFLLLALHRCLKTGSRAIRRRNQGETRVCFVNYPAQKNINSNESTSNNHLQMYLLIETKKKTNTTPMLVLRSQDTLKGLRERFLWSNMRKTVEINVLDLHPTPRCRWQTK